MTNFTMIPMSDFGCFSISCSYMKMIKEKTGFITIAICFRCITRLTGLFATGSLWPLINSEEVSLFSVT